MLHQKIMSVTSFIFGRPLHHLLFPTFQGNPSSQSLVVSCQELSDFETQFPVHEFWLTWHLIVVRCQYFQLPRRDSVKGCSWEELGRSKFLCKHLAVRASSTISCPELGYVMEKKREPWVHVASISACSISDTQSSTDQVQKDDQYDKVTVKQ